MNEALRRARRGALAIGIVFIGSTVGFHWLTGKPLLEALYWTIITIAGVGYSQDVDSSVGPGRQLLSIVVILTGMLAVAYTLGMFIQAIIEGQLDRAMGVRRMQREIDKLKDHTIICGFGRTGRHLAHRLARHHRPFVVIDPNGESAMEARAHNFHFIEGDATEDDVLQTAGIERAATIVIGLPNDANNVFLTLTARNMNPTLRILARGEHLSTEKKLVQAGADQVILPAIIGAERMADMIVKPQTSNLLKCVGHETGLNADVEEFVLREDNRLVGHTIRSAEIRERLQLLVVAIQRVEGEMLFNPTDATEFRAGDTMIVMGAEADLDHFHRNYDTADLAVAGACTTIN